MPMVGQKKTLDVPSDGVYTDGLLPWTPNVTLRDDAIDDLNEMLFYLAPADALSMDSQALTMAGSTLYAGYLSAGSANYEGGVGAGSSVVNITNDPTLTLTTPTTTTRFNKADEGALDWNINGVQIDTVSLVANFLEAQRAGTQLTTPWVGAAAKLSVTSVAWYNSFPKWQKGNAVATIVGADLRQGYNYFTIVHDGLTIIQTSTTYKIFYDDDAGANPTITGVPTAVIHTTVNTHQLSGVTFYNRGTTFKVGAVGADCFDNTYVLNPLVITSTASNSMGNANIPWNDATVAGLSNPPAIGETMTVTDKVITVPSSNVRSTNARVTVTPYDPFGTYTGVQSASENRLVDGYPYDQTGTSTDTAEYLDDEWYRLKSNMSLTEIGYASGTAGEGRPAAMIWLGSESLVGATAGYTDGLQVYNGQVIYPTLNFSAGYLPAAGQPDYSGAAGLRTYYRYFYVGDNKQNFTLTMSGTGSFVSVATGPSGQNLTLEMLAPNVTKNGAGTVEFKDCYVAYTTETAIGCYASGTRSTSTSDWKISLGGISTHDSGYTIVLRITAAAAWTGNVSTLSVVAS